MNKTIIYVLVVLTRISFISLQSCKYIVSLGINYYDVVDSKQGTFTTISECISDASLNASYSIAKVWIANAGLPTLEKNFISNMKTLEEIEIEKCFIDTIEPGAFSNVPQLKLIIMYQNPIKTLSRGVFDVIPSLEKIFIYDNKISFIEDHAFANLPNFKVFVFKNNKLDHMKREWFTNTSSIGTISLEHNLISTIPKGMFHGWKKLKYIFLGSNRISVIEGEMFKNNAPIITEVDLVHNRLTSLSLDIISDSVYIVHLILSGNLFNYFPEDFLRKIRVSHLYIYGNPFKCPCLEKIEKIAFDQEMTINGLIYQGSKACKDSSLPICGCSLNCSGPCIESVDKNLTQRLIASWKERDYDTVIDRNKHQCAVFN